MRQIRAHGQQKKHHHPILGLNGRLDTMQAAVVLCKLPLFEREIELRQEVAHKYTEGLRASPLVEAGIQLPELEEGNTSVWAQYTMLSPDRDALKERLTEALVPSVSYYSVPLHLQPVFEYLGHKNGDFPVTEKVANQCISLPMNPYLKEEEVNTVVAVFS